MINKTHEFHNQTFYNSCLLELDWLLSIDAEAQNNYTNACQLINQNQI